MAVAIIGVGGKFPLAQDVSEFQQNLKNGIDCVRPVSVKRKEDTTIEDKNYQVVGFLDDVDKFDHSFFDISKGEAQLMDPHQRLLLEVSYHTFENAGYDPKYFANSLTNVYVACPSFTYHHHFETVDPAAISGNINGMTPGVLSRYYKLLGASLLIDTTCSSSLVAVHMAARDLENGEAESALVCGANINLFPPVINEDLDFGVDAMDGKAKTFSASADGTGEGEALGCVLLKPLEKAERDGDNILAVIAGSAINQDAHRSSFLTAPSREAQTEVIIKAWEKSGVDPENIAYIETHGTGTKIGDPIEFDSIDNAFRKFTSKKGFCAISALKSNIGHTNTASGISGLIKVVMSLTNRELYPSLHFERPNPYIEFENSALYVNTLYQQLSKTISKFNAGISSFGLSGTNCHMVLEEYKKDDTDTRDKPCLILLSTSSEIELQNKVKSFKLHLEESTNIDLSGLSFTLSQGATHLNYKHAFVANNRVGTINEFDDYIKGTNKSSIDNNDPSQLIFSFSMEKAPSKEYIDQCRKSIPLFSEIYTQAESRFSHKNEELELFVFQYAVYLFLTEIGVKADQLLGFLSGDILVSFLSDEISEEQVYTELKKLKTVERNEWSDRLKKFVNDGYKNDKKFVFIEAGSQGVVGKELESYEEDNKCSCINASPDGDTAILKLLQEIYLKGIEIDWRRAFEGTNAKRISLPLHSFVKTHCWTKSKKVIQPSPTQNTPDFLYKLTWKEDSIDIENRKWVGEKILLVHRNDNTGQELFDDLKRDNDVLEIQSKNDSGRIDSEKIKSKAGFDKIIFWSSGNDFSPSDQIGNQTFFFECFNLLKSLNALLSKNPVQLYFITSAARKIAFSDTSLVLENALFHGFMPSLLKEYPLIKGKCVDVEIDSNSDYILQILKNEEAHQEKIVIGYRKGIRYLPEIININTLDVKKRTKSLITINGTYLITGASGGIGLEVLKYYSKKYVKAKWLLIGKSELPDHTNWKSVVEKNDHPKCDFINELLLLKKSGADLHYYSVDLGDSQKTKGAIERIQQEQGDVNGIFHLAGVPGDRLIKDHDQESFAQCMAPKVDGIKNLKEHLTSKPDFIVLFSSLAALVGEKRNTNYGAANLFLDAFSYQLEREGIETITIHWGSWGETGMYDRYMKLLGEERNRSNEISNIDGMNALDFIINHDQNNVYTIKGDKSTFVNNPYVLTNTLNKEKEISSQEGLEDNELYPDEVPLDSEWKYKNHWSKLQNIIGSLWFERLKEDELDLESDFFALGGNSLLGTQLTNRINQLLKINLSFENLYAYGTLAELVVHIESLTEEQSNKTDQEAVTPRGKNGILSDAQKGIWLLHQQEKDLSAYHMYGTYKAHGDLKVESLKLAFESLIKRHESLRTTFNTIKGEPRSNVHAFSKRFLDFEVIEENEGVDGHLDVDEFIDQEVVKSFDLENGPLVRIVIVKQSNQKFLIVLILHHIIADGWSINVIVDEISEFYSSSIEQKSNSLPALNTQYSDYADWEFSYLKSDLFQKSKQFLKTYLKDAPPSIKLPFDFTESSIKTYNGDFIWNDFDASLNKSILELGGSTKSSQFMILMAAVKALLFRYTGQHDIVIGTRVSGRSKIEWENQIGLFVNTLVVRTIVEGEHSFFDLLNQVKLNINAVMPHQKYPFTCLVSDIGHNNLRGGSSVFNVLVEMGDNINNSKPLELGNVKLTSYEPPIKQSKYDLAVRFNTTSHPGMLITYNTDLFERKTVSAFCDQLLILIETVANDPEIGLDKIDLLKRAPHTLEEPLDLDETFDFKF